MAPIHELINSPTQQPALSAQLFPEIDRDELTRLIIQNLSDLGYEQSASVLKRESGLELDSPMINRFIALVKEGDFDTAEKCIDQLHLVDDSDVVKTKIRFLIKRQKFLELLYLDESSNHALLLLRGEFHDLTDPKTIRSLTSLLMDKEREELQRPNGWLGDVTSSRDNLLNEISKYINPNEMIPKYRLMKLVQQAIQFQKSKNLYQFGDESKVSLYEDVKSNKTDFPNTVIKTLTNHDDEVWYVTFSHDGKLLATASADNMIYIYDVDDDFKILHALEGHKKQVMYASFSPDDSLLLTCSIESKSRLWNVKTGECQSEMSLSRDARIWCGDWSPDGDCFVLGSPDKEIALFDADTGEELYRWDGDVINDLKITDDYKLIAVTYDRNVKVWDLKTRKDVKTLQIDERITSVTVSKENPDLVLLNICPNELQLWDWKKSILVSKFVGHKQEKYVLRSCFGYNEQLVCSGSEDGRVFLWNKEFGALLGVFDGHKGISNCIAWNNARKNMFATSGDDRLVKIWAPSKK